MSDPRIHVPLAIGKTAAQVVSHFAQFSPVPGLSPAVDLLCTILKLCENVSSNKHLCRQLCERCISLLENLTTTTNANGDRLVGTDILVSTALQRVEDCLSGIRTRMDGWTRKSRWQQFAMQKEISGDIQRAHEEISDCLSSFQVNAHVEHLVWQQEFQRNVELDHEEILESLAAIKTTQEITNAAVTENNDLLRKIMSMMQENISNHPQSRAGLERNLHTLQFRTTERLLPQLELKRGAVHRISDRAVKGSWATEIFEGRYLQTEKVALKTLRPAIISPRVRRRFEREVKVWAHVTKLDSGKHILPFYGYCTTGDLGLCMVSPWMRNGNALEYVKQNDKEVDYKRLIRGVALGLEFLHGLDPPVVHGDVKADNIVINDYGEPLLIDFGLAHELHNADIGDGNTNTTGTGPGIPFSQSHGVSHSYRWFAPELTYQEGTLSSSADIYAFGMTILELLTHQQPYDHLKHLPTVLNHASSGKRPRRPTDAAVVRRGLDDAMWALLSWCWTHEPARRPAISGVLEDGALAGGGL